MTKRANGEGSVYRRADGRWEAAAFVLSVSGRRRIRVYGHTREQARTKLVEHLVKSAQGVPVPDRAWRVGEYLDYWLQHVVRTRNRPRTVELYESTIRLQLKPLLGGKPLRTLSVRDVQTAFNALLGGGASPRTVHKARTVLSSALSRGLREEVVARNVARLVDLPAYERREIRPWTLDDASAFLAVSHAHRWGLGYLLLLTYGMRRGEVLGLTWGDVDFEAGVIHVVRQLQRIEGVLQRVPVKTSAGRRDLPLLPTVRAELRRHAETLSNAGESPSTGQFVLLSKTGTPVDPKNFVRTFHELRDAAGLPRITVHHARHTTATLLKRLGVDARDAQLILGHASVTTTQMLYQHGDVEAQRNALEHIERALGAASEHARVWDGARSRQVAVTEDVVQAVVQERRRTKTPRSAGVKGDAVRGGTSGARTHDTLLKRGLKTALYGLPTPVIRAALTRTRTRVIGCVAVRTCRQGGGDAASDARDLIAIERELGQVLAEHQRGQRYPFALLQQSA